jgi:hypothetical protein
MNKTVIEILTLWREEDQADSIVLNRNQVIELLEEIERIDNGRA